MANALNKSVITIYIEDNFRQRSEQEEERQKFARFCSSNRLEFKTLPEKCYLVRTTSIYVLTVCSVRICEKYARHHVDVRARLGLFTHLNIARNIIEQKQNKKKH